MKSKPLCLLLALVLCLSLVLTACAPDAETEANEANAEANEAKAAESDSSRTVYITKSGECYHKENCIYLSSSCIKTTLESAERRGYRPCSKCY